FKNYKEFEAFAEKKFRFQFKIPANHGINATKFMFEDDKFQLPLNMFFTDKGLLLYYNRYEIASYADGPQELLLTYDELKGYLLFK
ncbi:MAG: RsiV family protein, partial [Flavobacterium sp.]|nr:RsiV family protein [Flavobacterium sp.]